MIILTSGASTIYLENPEIGAEGITELPNVDLPLAGDKIKRFRDATWLPIERLKYTVYIGNEVFDDEDPLTTEISSYAEVQTFLLATVGHKLTVTFPDETSTYGVLIVDSMERVHECDWKMEFTLEEVT